MRRTTFLVTLLLLTPHAVIAGELVGPGRWFIRFTNVRPDHDRILIRLNVVPNDAEPFDWKGVTVYVGGQGVSQRPPEEDQWLKTDESSPWIDIGPYMMLQGARSGPGYCSPVLCGVLTADKRDGLHLVAELAQGDGDRIVRRIEVHKPEIRYEGAREYPWRLGYGTWNGERPAVPTLGLMVPTRTEAGNRIYTLDEALRWQLEVIDAFPQRGRAPKEFVFRTIGRPEILSALGYNGYPADTFEANLGDEIQIELKMPQEEQDRRFRDSLRSRGFDPLELLPDIERERLRDAVPEQQWEAVHLLPPMPDRPKQFFESANFRYQLWHEELGARARKAEREHPDERVLAGANFTPAGYGWPDVRHWIMPFKSGALTMAWSEDWWWQLADPTPQTTGFQLDALRLAGSYHGAPIQFYVMPFQGQSPDNFRRMNALAVAHGAKILNHFHTEDQVLTTWDYIDLMDGPAMYQAIHDVIRDVGAVERRLYPAMPSKAQVAIMVSRAADTWDTEDLGGAGDLTEAKYNVNHYERKAIWLALRQAQSPVDLITDEDIAEGALDAYRVLYVVGAEMMASAAEPLQKWVREGGCLYATAGGGMLDEYRQPIHPMSALYGLEGHDLNRVERQIGPRHSLPKTPVLDTLKVERGDGIVAERSIAAVCYRETLRPMSDSHAVGRYEKDGAVGAVVHNFGKGRTMYVGALAGLDFLKPAMIADASVLPTAFEPASREFLLTPVRWAGIVPPVKAADPLVETQYMVGPSGAGVVVINWKHEPIDLLTIRFPGLKNVRRVRSLRKAGLFQGYLDEQPTAELPIEQVAGVSQVRLRLEVADYLIVDAE